MITLYTSGSTDLPKEISHSDIHRYIDISIKTIGLTSTDTVLDVFPSNVIAHYTITAQPALKAGAHLISTVFDPYSYITLFKKYRPSVIALIPRHIEILSKTKSWHDLDMSCVRYMVTGSQKVTQHMIDSLNKKGVNIVANWYGMTEFPPPVFIGINSEKFDFSNSNNYDIEFSDEGECIINGFQTGDIFHLQSNTFSHRISSVYNKTWKN